MDLEFESAAINPDSSASEEWTPESPFGTFKVMLKAIESLKAGDLFANE